MSGVTQEGESPGRCPRAHLQTGGYPLLEVQGVLEPSAIFCEGVSYLEGVRLGAQLVVDEVHNCRQFRDLNFAPGPRSLAAPVVVPQVKGEVPQRIGEEDVETHVAQYPAVAGLCQLVLLKK